MIIKTLRLAATPVCIAVMCICGAIVYTPAEAWAERPKLFRRLRKEAYGHEKG